MVSVRDQFVGGTGGDRFLNKDGVRELVRGGPARDYAKADTGGTESTMRDELRSLEHVGDVCAAGTTP